MDLPLFANAYFIYININNNNKNKNTTTALKHLGVLRRNLPEQKKQVAVKFNQSQFSPRWQK